MQAIGLIRSHTKTDVTFRVLTFDSKPLCGRKLLNLLLKEAYLGEKDPACHTFNGRRTSRVESMYLPGGHAYVYLIYGIHYCFNVVTKSTLKPEAVLIRALWPCDGKEIMSKRRKIKIEAQLCSGPGKLCEAMAIDRKTNGLLLSGPELWIEEDINYFKIKKYIQKSPHVGIDYAGKAKKWLLRYSIDPKIFQPNE